MIVFYENEIEWKHIICRSFHGTAKYKNVANDDVLLEKDATFSFWIKKQCLKKRYYMKSNPKIITIPVISLHVKHVFIMILLNSQKYDTVSYRFQIMWSWKFATNRIGEHFIKLLK